MYQIKVTDFTYGLIRHYSKFRNCRKWRTILWSDQNKMVTDRATVKFQFQRSDSTSEATRSLVYRAVSLFVLIRLCIHFSPISI